MVGTCTCPCVAAPRPCEPRGKAAALQARGEERGEGRLAAKPRQSGARRAAGALRARGEGRRVMSRQSPAACRGKAACRFYKQL